MTTTNLVIDFDKIEQKRDIVYRIGALRGLWEVRLKKRIYNRTIPQNRYYHGAVVEAFNKAMMEQGEADDHDARHEDLADMFLRRGTQYANTLTGEIKTKYRTLSTTELSIEEFSNYIELCCKFLAETFGIVILSSEQWLEEDATGKA